MKKCVLSLVVVATALFGVAIYYIHNRGQKAELAERQLIARAVSSGIMISGSILKCDNGAKVCSFSEPQEDPYFEEVVFSTGPSPKLIEIRYRPDMVRLSKKLKADQIKDLFADVGWSIFRPSDHPSEATRTVQDSSLPAGCSYKILERDRHNRVFSGKLEEALSTIARGGPSYYRFLLEGK
jgi:hypothetical protein